MAFRRIVTKILTIALSFLWLVMAALQLLVWNTTIRTFLFDDNPAFEISASLLNDLIWVPVALCLPIYLVFFILKGTRNFWLRLSGLAVGWLILLIALLHLGEYFGYLFYLIVPFSALLFHHIVFVRPVRIHIILFTVTLYGLIMHYQTQLFPRLMLLHPSQQSTFSIMTYNIMTYQPMENQLQSIEFIKEEKPDLLFLQEMDKSLRSLLKSRISKYYPYQLWADESMDYSGGVILSRFPIVSSTNIGIGTIYSKDQSNLNHAIINYNGQNIHLYNCHLFHGSHYFIDLVRKETNRKQRWKNFLNASLRHQGEAAKIASLVFGKNEPVILVGDFNNTPNSAIYHLFNDSLNNAFEKAGWGLGTTFGYKSIKAMIPPALDFLLFDFLRIDHIFCSHDFDIISARVYPVDGSDHRPMMAIVRLKSKK
jgi:endonuclease/exonuclease/phosphatase (EEP) superfamily protein YafD